MVRVALVVEVVAVSTTAQVCFLMAGHTPSQLGLEALEQFCLAGVRTTAGHLQSLGLSGLVVAPEGSPLAVTVGDAVAVQQRLLLAVSLGLAIKDQTGGVPLQRLVAAVVEVAAPLAEA